MRVAIIGGGIVGLATAYNLAKDGVDVVVFERKYLLYGASGRNSGGITAMLNNERLIEMAKKSMKIYDEVQSEIGFNFLYRKDGYIKVASTENDLNKLKEEMNLQKRMGVKVKQIDANEVKDFIPDFNADAVIGGVYGEGGVIFPWPVIWGYAKGCRELGVDVKDYTTVEEIVVKDRAIDGVKANGEFFKVDFIVNAAGAWSNEISRMAGVELNNKIIKEEICVTESLKPYLDPYLLDVTTGIYLSQSMRGEIVGGIVGNEVESIDVKGSLDFLVKYAKRAVELIPKLKGLCILRQWAGVYDEGKDIPNISTTNVKGFIQANGFGKFGMCLAPAAAIEVTRLIRKT
ncbi:FAD-binding oxidoreductase [Archaeoglobales archaeon]|nr:MAG: FAD-binding oxidoreductase [Archaeoglobales archaeon]